MGDTGGQLADRSQLLALDELRLHLFELPVRPFHLGIRDNEILFRCLALRDVPGDGDHRCRRVVAVPDGGVCGPVETALMSVRIGYLDVAVMSPPITEGPEHHAADRITGLITVMIEPVALAALRVVSEELPVGFVGPNNGQGPIDHDRWIAETLQHGVQLAPALPQGFLGPLSLQGVANRPGQYGRIELFLDQIVLRSLGQSLAPQFLAAVARYHNLDNARMDLLNRHQCTETAAVRQVQVEQHHVDLARVQDRERLLQAPGDLRVLRLKGRLRQRSLDLHRIDLIVFHNEDSQGTGFR